MGGVGGSGGEGGSGGSPSNLPPGYVPVRAIGPISPEDLPPNRRWLADPEAWRLIPPEEMSDDYCYYFYSDKPEKLPFSPLEWKSCGEGCFETDLAPNASDFITKPGLATLPTPTRGGIAYLSLGHGTTAAKGRWIAVERLIDLSTGRTLSALKLDSLAGTGSEACALGLADPPTRRRLIWYRKDEGTGRSWRRSTAATWDFLRSTWTVTQPWSQTAGGADESCRILAYSYLGHVLIGCRGIGVYAQSHLFIAYSRREEKHVEPWIIRPWVVRAFRRHDLSKLDLIGLPECGEEGITCQVYHLP